MSLSRSPNDQGPDNIIQGTRRAQPQHSAYGAIPQAGSVAQPSTQAAIPQSSVQAAVLPAVPANSVPTASIFGPSKRARVEDDYDSDEAPGSKRTRYERLYSLSAEWKDSEGQIHYGIQPPLKPKFLFPKPGGYLYTLLAQQAAEAEVKKNLGYEKLWKGNVFTLPKPTITTTKAPSRYVKVLVGPEAQKVPPNHERCCVRLLSHLPQRL